MVGAHAYLFIGVEGDAYLAVLDFFVLLQIDHRLYNLSNACLIVGTQQSGAVSDN